VAVTLTLRFLATLPTGPVVENARYSLVHSMIRVRILLPVSFFHFLLLFNPRIALLFLRTPVALGDKKSPHEFTTNSNMAAQTRSTYFSGTMIDSVEIPTEILEFSTTMSSKKVPPNDCVSDRQPEMAIRQSKPEILIYLEL